MGPLEKPNPPGTSNKAEGYFSAPTASTAATAIGAGSGVSCGSGDVAGGDGAAVGDMPGDHVDGGCAAAAPQRPHQAGPSCSESLGLGILTHPGAGGPGTGFLDPPVLDRRGLASVAAVGMDLSDPPIPARVCREPAAGSAAAAADGAGMGFGNHLAVAARHDGPAAAAAVAGSDSHSLPEPLGEYGSSTARGSFSEISTSTPELSGGRPVMAAAAGYGGASRHPAGAAADVGGASFAAGFLGLRLSPADPAERVGDLPGAAAGGDERRREGGGGPSRAAALEERNLEESLLCPITQVREFQFLRLGTIRHGFLVNLPARYVLLLLLRCK